MDKNLSDCDVKSVDSVDFPRILKFLSNQLPNYYHVYNMINSAVYSKNSFYRLYILQNRNNHGVDNPLAILGLNEQKYYTQNSKDMRSNWIFTTWSSTDFNAIVKIYKSLDIVDWARDAFLIFSLDHERDSRLNNYLNVQFKNKRITSFPSEQYVMEPSNALNLKIEYGFWIPDEVYVDSLKSCNAQQVHDFYPYRHSAAIEDIAKEIEQLPSVGVFRKENHQLVSWITQRSSFAMGRLHTLEAFRHRGYARLAIHSMSKKMAEAGFTPLIYTDIENDPSRALVLSAGFRYNQTIACLWVEPFDDSYYVPQ